MATTVVDRVFVDTNVLMYANLTASPFNSPAVAALQSLHARGVELWVSRQILREYLASMSRPGGLTGLITNGIARGRCANV